MRAFFALNLAQQREPFRGDFRIRQNILDCGELGFRKEKSVRQPVEQALVKQLLRPDIGAEDPGGAADFSSDGGDQDRLGRLGHVRKCDRTHSVCEVPQFLGNRFCPGYNQGQGIARRIFHRKCFAGSRRSSMAVVAQECGSGRQDLRARIVRASYRSRPTALATARKRGTSLASISGTRACSPSLLARSGEWWTSSMMASAPAATAAIDICGINSRRPTP